MTEFLMLWEITIKYQIGADVGADTCRCSNSLIPDFFPHLYVNKENLHLCICFHYQWMTNLVIRCWYTSHIVCFIYSGNWCLGKDLRPPALWHRPSLLSMQWTSDRVPMVTHPGLQDRVWSFKYYSDDWKNWLILLVPEIRYWIALLPVQASSRMNSTFK